MKRYFTLPQKRKKRFSFVLGVGDITGTFKTKKLHLRYTGCITGRSRAFSLFGGGSAQYPRM